MIALVDAAALHDAGAKARTLGRARAAGLPVLDGFVVLPGEELDAAEIAAALRGLGGERFAVRSSATVEDLPGASAAGVFESLIGVPAIEVVAAIEQVRAGASRQAAEAYLAARGLLAGRLEMAVIVQPLARAARLGVLRVPGADEGGWLEAEERDAGEPEHGQVEPRRVAASDPLAALGRRAAALVGGEADVEYALGDEGPLLLQARPLTAPPPRRDPQRWRLEEPGTWALDEEHNPEPLSEAQASLVARLGRVPGLGAQRVVHGWLYVRVDGGGGGANGGAAPAGRLDASSVAGGLDTSSVANGLDGSSVAEGLDASTMANGLDAAELLARSIAPRADALLAPLEASAEPDLEAALAAFDAVARLHGVELRPVLRRERAALDRLLQRSIGERLAGHGDLLAGTGGRTLARDLLLWQAGRAGGDEAREAWLGRCLAEHGACSPAWDVAVPCDDEEPERLRRAAALVARAESPERRHGEALLVAQAAARRLADRMSREDAAALAALLPRVRAAMTVAEDDDALFFRAQRLVRRALLALGARAAAAGRLDGAWQIVDLPIEEVLADRLDAGRARGLRALRESRARLSPPSQIREGVPSWHGGGGGEVLGGVGTGGRGYGRALRVREGEVPTAGAARGAVLVMRAVLPSITFLLPVAAGLVTDVGGALSHAATLAREYGVPAVLGTGSATRTLRDGDDLIVDGDHGRVYRLGGT